jgi:glycosyltransferase involved in cell wall biosynthesis
MQTGAMDSRFSTSENPRILSRENRSRSHSLYRSASRADDPEAAIHPITEGQEYLIFPSQLWIHKGHETLVRALAILKDNYNLNIRILCPGFQKDFRFPNHFRNICDLTRKLGVANNIRFLGFLDRTLQMQLMRGAKAVVQPSRFEGWSALIEDAQSIGKPIIASDISIHREQDPPDTTFFSENDPESLAATITSQWSNLPSGFDLEREKIGRRRQQQRIHTFGHDFANLLREI